MAEYIDRNYIVKAYIDLCKALSQKSKICPGADEPTVKNVFAIVMHAPAADVVEVRHGRWKNGGNGLYDICTACGKEIYLAIPMNYCPECGALMGGKEDEHEAD